MSKKKRVALSRFLESRSDDLEKQAVIILKNAPRFAGYVARIERENQAQLAAIQTLVDAFGSALKAAETGDNMAFMETVKAVQASMNDVSRPFIEKQQEADKLCGTARAAIEAAAGLEEGEEKLSEALSDMVRGVTSALKDVGIQSPDELRLLKNRAERYARDFAIQTQ